MAQFSRLTSEIDAILDDVVAAKGSSASLAAAMAAKLDTSTYTDEDTKVKAALAALIDKGAKNRLPFSLATMQTANTGGTWESSNVYKFHEVYFTVDEAANTITCTGTANASNTFFQIAPSFTVDHDMMLTGCPEGGVSGETQNFSLRWGTSATYRDNGSGVLINTTGTNQVRVLIAQSYAIPSGGIVFKPMMCSAAEYEFSTAFVPYAPTNAELLAMIRAL